MLNYFQVIFMLSSVTILISGQSRIVNHWLNPGCSLTICDNNTIFVHIAADGENDTLHHIWDFTGKPTVFLALTPLKTKLTVNWEEFLWNGEKGSVKFSNDILYSFSLVFDKVIEFNDENNTAHYNPTNHSEQYVNFIRPDTFKWKINKNEFGKDFVKYELEGSGLKAGNISKPGSIKITLNAFGHSEHSSLQPHLLHTDNATQIDFVLDGLKVKFAQSRFALGMFIVSTDDKKSNLTQIKKKSLDDEHSPGIFTIGEVLTPMNTSDPGGYLQWRTVAYTSSSRLMTYSTDVVETTATHVENPIERLNLSVVLSCFGERLYTLPVHELFMSFGSPDDGFYAKTGYLSWTVLAGVGKPAEEGFSLLIMFILAIGLGLPALLIIIGSICIIARRIARKRDAIFITN